MQFDDVTVGALDQPLVSAEVIAELPPMVECRISFERPRVADVVEAVRQSLAQLPALAEMKPGQTVAITAGSRGINNIVSILRSACAGLRERGLRPVVVSAMGSHGGDTSHGQRQLLASLGIDGLALGDVPLLCSTDTVEVGRTQDGRPVKIDAFCAREADGVLVINRIKPHTAFRSSTESGLLKMIAVGLGHQSGAASVHAEGAAKMGATVREMAAVAMGALPIVGGLAIVENGYEETAEIVPLTPAEFVPGEERLLAWARALMPRLPVREADLLVIEQIGKEISGTGMDTNVHGRWGASDPGPAAGSSPSYARLVVLDLTEASHGNATGIGLADFTTERVVRAFDRKSTYTNCLTSTYVDRARLPLFLPDDRQAIAAAVVSLGAARDRSRLRVVQIKDTLHLETFRISTPLLTELGLSAATGGACVAGSAVRVVGEPVPMQFDEAGNLARLA